MMDGESEFDDFMLEPEAMEGYETMRIRSKAPPVEGDETSRGRPQRSYNSTESQRNRSPKKTRSTSPVLQIKGEGTTEGALQVWSRVSRSYSSAESPMRRKSPLLPRNSSTENPDEVQETQEGTPESRLRASSGRGRPRSHSSVESPRAKSPTAPQSTSPKMRRSFKKGHVGGDGSDYSKSNGSRRRGSLGSVGSSQIRERNSGSGHSRRTGGSSHGSSQTRERFLGNTVSDSSQKGTINIRERLLGSTNSESNRPGSSGSSHGRLASRRNLIQTTHDQSPENKEEKDQLSDSTRSAKKVVGAPSPASTGPRISWKSDPKASFCDWR
jgi:hypothetical protein